jgi:RNA polymerase sigma-70 factor, ECF subfamily
MRQQGTDITFEPLRARLAYRMLGSRAEAEDIVQDTYLRWHQADQMSIDNVEAWLVTAATRRSIDRRRALKAERAACHGASLSGSLLLREEPPPPDRPLEVSSDLSMAFVVLLERLAPEERAAFLLHEVFDCNYGQISKTLGKRPSACRQIVHRARNRVSRGRPRFRVSEAARIRLRQKFTAAMEARDQDALLALLRPTQRGQLMVARAFPPPSSRSTAPIDSPS